MIDAFFDVAPKALTLMAVLFGGVLLVKVDEILVRRREARRVIRRFAGNRIPLDPDTVTVGQLAELERAYRIQHPQFSAHPNRSQIGHAAEVSALASAGEVPDARASDLT